MATQSVTLAWEVPWTEEPGGLQSMESKKVRHNRECTRRAIHILVFLLVLHFQCIFKENMS